MIIIMIMIIVIIIVIIMIIGVFLWSISRDEAINRLNNFVLEDKDVL